MWGTTVGAPVTLTYSFPTSTSLFSPGYGVEVTQFQPMTAAEQDAVRRALQTWAEVANITFQEVPESSTQVGDLRFANSGVIGDYGAAAWAYYPSSRPTGGDVWVDTGYSNAPFTEGSFSFRAVVHEIGHALGLSHPFSDSDDPDKPVLPNAQDNQRYSIMSYSSYGPATIDAYGPMLYDILAIQHLYGANMTTRTGDDVYNFSSSKEYLEVIWDAGGHDTIDLSNQTRNQVIDLREGTFSSIGVKNNGVTAVGNVGIAFGVAIEDAVGGSGSDTITGNDVDNSLSGGAGNDTLSGGVGKDALNGGANDDWLDGGVGNDTLTGGAGNDTYVIGAGDVIDEQGNADTGDLVRADISVDLSTFANGAIEHATLLGTSALNAIGSSAANRLTGNSAANTLNGLGGADILAGGNGNDTYIVGESGDQVIESTSGATGGVDLVMSSVSFVLGANVENLTLAGTGNINATGNGQKNSLIGNDGANRLDGGAGDDTMTGGKGNDVYMVNTSGDVVNETVLNSAGGGVDTVVSGITFSLATRANIENLTLTGTAKNGTGNVLNNIILGNASNNTLDGGAGADILKGGAGNDTYIFDSLADVANEETNQDSADLIRTTVVITTAFAGIENYTYVGSQSWTFTGNAASNMIVGGSGNDILAGLAGDDWLDGGNGHDTMKGGTGNDTYVIGSASDSIDDGGNADTGDLVRSTVTVNLATLAGGAIENATLLGGSAISATGNTANNELTGNSDANALSGEGGNDFLHGGGDADKLTGGAGQDIFDFDFVGDLGDTITDFARGGSGDKLDISDLLDSVSYVAVDNIFDDGYLSFSYAGTTTNILFDADGLGNNAATTLASLLNVNLTSADIGSFIV